MSFFHFAMKLALLLQCVLFLQQAFAYDIINAKTIRATSITAGSFLNREGEVELCIEDSARLGLRLYLDRKAHSALTEASNWHYQLKIDLYAGLSPDPINAEPIVLRLEAKQEQKLQNLQAAYLTDNFAVIDFRQIQIKVVEIDAAGAPNARIYLDLEHHYSGYRMVPWELEKVRIDFKPPVAPNHQMLVFWEYIQGAEEYDLEWVHIDSYDAVFVFDPNYPEKPFLYKEPTRVSTHQQHFLFELTYPSGNLYFRVRGKSRFPQKKEQVQYGRWYYPTLATGLNKRTLPDDFLKTKKKVEFCIFQNAKPTFSDEQVHRSQSYGIFRKKQLDRKFIKKKICLHVCSRTDSEQKCSIS